MSAFIAGHGKLVLIGHQYSNLTVQSKIFIRSKFQIVISSGGY